MKKNYKLNHKFLRRLLLDNLIMTVFLIIAFPFYWEWKNGTGIVLDRQIIMIFGVIILVANIPSILIYLHYYFENRNTSFILDFESKTITITQNGITKEYSKKEVETSHYHLGIYYKNAIDRAGRMPMLISDFGYWDLTFKNGDRYFLTNLLHDFIHDPPFLMKTRYRFRIFPYVNKSDYKKTLNLFKELERKKEKSRTEKFVDQFQSKSEAQLKDILVNRSKYQKEAVKAAEILFTRPSTIKPQKLQTSLSLKLITMEASETRLQQQFQVMI